MHSPETNGITYYLPLKVKSDFTPIQHMLCLSVFGACIGIWWIPQMPTWAQGLIAALGVILLGFYVYTACIHGCWLRLDTDCFYFHLPFRTVSIPLAEIDTVAVRGMRYLSVLKVTTVRLKRYSVPVFLFGSVSAELLENTLKISSQKVLAALPEAENADEAETHALQYLMPFKLYSKMSVGQHILWIVCSLAFLFMTFLYSVWITESFLSGILFLLFSLLCFLFSISFWLYYGIFRKAYIYGDENELQIKQFLGKTAHIPWENIALVDFVDTGKYGTIYPRAGKGSHIRIVTYAADGQIYSNQFLFRRNPNLHLIQLSMFQTLRPYLFVRTVCEQVERCKTEAENLSE